jgi:hypothetical protein
MREIEPEHFFRFFENLTTDTSDHTVSSASYTIPFENDSFDIVVSTQTLEHVLQPAPIMAEIARVLSPRGLALNLYPDLKRVIEPHIYVPFATRTKKWWWLYLWGLLGIRNEFQKAMSARKVADQNLRYLETGVKYLTDPEMKACADPYFGEVSFPARAFYGRPDRKAKLQAVFQAFCSADRFAKLAPLPPLNVLLTARKRVVHQFWRVAPPFEPTTDGYVGKLPAALSTAPQDALVLFQDNKLAGQTVALQPSATVVIAPADWPKSKLASVKFDLAVGKVRQIENFRDHPGHMFGVEIADLAPLADDVAPVNNSPVILFEDKRQLPHPHSLHVDIHALGAGRFSHWKDEMLFSTSDNSDPRTNGRQYELVVLSPPTSSK